MGQVGLFWGWLAPLATVCVISAGQLLFKLAAGHLDFRRPLAEPKGLVILGAALALYGGATLVWVMIPLAVIAVAMWWLGRRGTAGKGLTVAVSVLAVVASLGTVVDVGLIGHSGAKAAWHDVPAAKSGG